MLDRNESNSGLATKRNKESGRLTLDCSRPVVGRSDEAIPLNTEEAARRWGTIAHPTVEDLVRIVLRVARRVGWDAVVIWKSDLKNAFGRLDFNPSDVHLLTTSNTEGYVVVYLRGNKSD